jgi:putative membrane protein
MIRQLLFCTLTGALICGSAAFAQPANDQQQSDRAAEDRDLGNVVQKDAQELGEPGNENPEQRWDDNTPMTAERVLNFLHWNSMKEIKMGKMAQEKGESQEVKDFGQRLVTDHQNADKRVMQVAQQEGIELKEMKDGHKYGDKKDHKTDDDGTDDDKVDAYDKNADAGVKKSDDDNKMNEKAKWEELKNATGADFDRRFTMMAAKGHAKTIGKLQKAQDEIDSDPVKQLIAELLPTLQQHQQVAEQLGAR